jgi:cytidylate kinase
MAVITVSRQYGSGGDEIAAEVCDLLEYKYFDKHLMVEAAAEAGLCEHEVFDFSEERYEVRSFLSRLFRAGPAPVYHATLRHRTSTGQETLTARALDEEECIDLVRYTVLSAYQAGNMLILGRGGQAILREQPNVLHVRVIAPLEARIKRLQERGMSGIADIKQKIADRDRATAAYLKRFHGIDWDDVSLYHLVLNTGKLSLPAASRIIVDTVKQIESVTVA